MLLSGRITRLALLASSSLSRKGSYRDKHSSLFNPFINYDRESFITLASEPIVIKLFTAKFINVNNKLECLSLESLSS